MNTSKELAVKSFPSRLRLLPGAKAEKELSVSELWSVLLRRKRILLACLGFIVGLGILHCATATRLYRATSQIQIQKDNTDALGLENMMGSAENESDALDANISLQTQAQVLQSDSLALQVIDSLKLEQNQDFQSRGNFIAKIAGWFSSPSTQLANLTLDQDPSRRTRVLKIFASHLEVKPVSGTRLINVSYLNSDPKVAGEVVNALVQGLLEYNFQTRHNATQKAAGWLSNQLADLRKQSEDLQAKVVQLQRDSGVFTLGQTDQQGREQIYTPILDRLQQATTQLSQAQSARIIKGSLYQVVKDGDPELISGLSGNGTLAAASPGISGSLNLIQNLRGQEATVQAQYDELSAKFGTGYPKLTELKASLESTQTAIRAESTRIAGRVKNDFNVAENVENNARAVFLDEKQQAETLNSKAVEYEITRQEAVQSRNLYENLLRRLKEADLVAGLRSSNITIIDPARTPSRPAKPNIPLYLVASVGAGLFLGLCVALFQDATDTKIQGIGVLEAEFGHTPLGILPFHKRDRAVELATNSLRRKPSLTGGIRALVTTPRRVTTLPALVEPNAIYTEALRTLRTALMRSNGGSPPKVILVTSSMSGEGKSMLSANLAVLLAQQSKRVLLVECDLRTPVLHQHFHIKNEIGLSSVLTGRYRLEDALFTAVPMKGMPGLDVITAGPVPQSPAELLASEKMTELIDTWKKDYDFIVMDGVPVLPVTDSLLLTSYADLTLVIARCHVTHLQSLERTCSLLQAHATEKVALVLNGVERSACTFYGYTDSHYYGGKKWVS
jgi:succinoglycan biosynthesis transport protein ExoP